MLLKKIPLFCVLGAGLLLGGFNAPASAAQPVTEENLPALLGKALREHPEIVMEILRNNSEAALDIVQQGSNMRRKRNLEGQWREDSKNTKSVRLEGRPVLGAAKAKVRIVAFSDFTCHFCQQASGTVDAIFKEYGKDVSLVFKHLPMDEKGPGGMASAYFVAIAEQSEEKAWKFYKAMYAGRDRLTTEGEAFVKTTAQELGLDMKRLGRDVRSKKVTDILAEDQEDAQKLGVEGTPYFLINKLVVRGALPLDLFKGAVDMALKQSK